MYGLIQISTETRIRALDSYANENNANNNHEIIVNTFWLLYIFHAVRFQRVLQSSYPIHFSGFSDRIPA